MPLLVTLPNVLELPEDPPEPSGSINVLEEGPDGLVRGEEEAQGSACPPQTVQVDRAVNQAKGLSCEAHRPGRNSLPTYQGLDVQGNQLKQATAIFLQAHRQGI